MIKTLRLFAGRGAIAVGTLVISASAFAQAPSDAQREAIRSACRSDYIAHCSSVPPGGAESLQCLQKNMSSLSAACKTAVNAVQPPATRTDVPAAAPKAETPAAAEPAKPPEAAAPATPAPTPAAPAATTAAPKAVPATPKAATAAKKPSDAQIAAIRSACRSDYPKVCAGVPTGGAPALQCLQKNKANVSSPCQQALDAATGGATTAAPAATPPAAPAPALTLRPMRPREELFVLRSACGGDVRSLCGGVAPGGGRIVQCLATNAASLSPACKDVLSQFRAQ
ncbi:MAG: hypothetical protein QOD11_3346 [Bradyrhizobium sp.]|jgi:hypothetical protein|nr:hypothetical protein [Bradyrhizobium sp.]